LTYWTPIEQSPRESASGTPPLEAARPPLEVVSLDSNTRSPMDMESDNGFVHPKAILLPRLAEPGSLLSSYLVDSHYQQHQFDLDSAYPPVPKDLPDTRSIGLGIVLDEHCSQEDQAVLEPPPFNTYMNCRLQPDPVLTNPPDPELPRPDDNPILSSPSSAEFHPFCTSPDNPFHQQAEILSNPLALWLNRGPDSPELEKVTGIALLEPAGGPCMTREIVSPILSSQFLGSATIGDSWLNSVLRVHDESTRNPTPEF
jgi:hypothetical protein